MTTSTQIILAGGGTAGHVNPLLSVAHALTELDTHVDIRVIGTQEGLEHELVPRAGFPLECIEKLPFPRRVNKAALEFPYRWTVETRKVKAILQAHQTKLVVGFGGYASAPVYSVAHKLGIPFAMHEQNAKAGMANRLGARWADYIATAYSHTGLQPRSGVLMERVGLPLRPAIARLSRNMSENRTEVRARMAQKLGIDPNRPVIVITGGSLGAVSINEAIAQSSAAILPYAQVIHLTGKGKNERVEEIVAATSGGSVLNDVRPEHAGQGDYHVTPYMERIDEAFGCADLVICRSGAGTVSELSALGIPAIYVPLAVGNGEQRLNALEVVESGGALLVANSEFNSDWIVDNVIPLLNNESRLHELQVASWDYGIRDAAEVMAHKVLELVR